MWLKLQSTFTFASSNSVHCTTAQTAPVRLSSSSSSDHVESIFKFSIQGWCWEPEKCTAESHRRLFVPWVLQQFLTQTDAWVSPVAAMIHAWRMRITGGASWTPANMAAVELFSCSQRVPSCGRFYARHQIRGSRLCLNLCIEVNQHEQNDHYNVLPQGQGFIDDSLLLQPCLCYRYVLQFDYGPPFAHSCCAHIYLIWEK